MGQKQVFQTGLTDVKFNPTNVYPEQLGTIRMENNKVYKYVAFSGTTIVAVGDVVCYVVYASSHDGTIVDSANTVEGAGVAQAAVPVGTAASGALAYATGWIQIQGIATVSTTVAGSAAAGDAVTTASASTSQLTKNAGAATQVVGTLRDATAKVIWANFPY